MSENPKTATLIYGGQSYEMPLIYGTEGEVAMDISDLRQNTGLITMDIGYKNTGSTSSAITFLDGERGILHYRGYPIEELAEKASFLEVAYLLIYGVLPNKKTLADFESGVTQHTLVHEDMRKMFDAMPAGAHPMGVLGTMVASLSTFYPKALDPYRPPAEVDLTITRCLAKIPTIAAWAYKNEMGHPMVYPDNSLDYTSRFLKMMFSLPTQEYIEDPIVSDALNKLLILHADHEQNCSTSTVRIVGSSLANLYSAIAAAINALGGPLHGGANQAVIDMLEQIKREKLSTKTFIEKVKDKNNPYRLMGFGHRIYKNFDPRAQIIRKACDDVLKQLGVKDPLLELAKELEDAALHDEYFVERKLYPNVDFYSGIIYRALGIPTEMFTVMFALGRLPGWIAQWREMMIMKQPIGRPRQIYVGDVNRTYVPLDQRD